MRKQKARRALRLLILLTSSLVSTVAHRGKLSSGAGGGGLDQILKLGEKSLKQCEAGVVDEMVL
jgi:hypothetical protein